MTESIQVKTCIYCGEEFDKQSVGLFYPCGRKDNRYCSANCQRLDYEEAIGYEE